MGGVAWNIARERRHVLIMILKFPRHLFRSENEHIYIAIARVLAEKFPHRIGSAEVKTILTNKGLECSDEVLEYALSQLSELQYQGRGNLLRAEYFFNLLDYDELSEARSNSRVAACFSIAAILLSGISVLLAWRGTVRIDQSQFEIFQEIYDRIPPMISFI